MERQLLKGMLFLLLIISQAFAQNKVVTGTVIGKDDGLPLMGVSVVIKGTKTGVQTSANGKYSISVPSNAVLVFSYISFTTQERAVGSLSVLNISMETANTALTEVVVTSFGVKREKKALGYAVSTVDKKDLENRPETDIARVLNGKAPGLSVVETSGLSGSGTNIVVRAISTITGSSQPLFVVDGVPFDGATNANSDFTYGTTTSSRFLDLDPNNIESVNILKGLSATTLYGEAGRNGVIVITTKNGSTQQVKKKTEISVSQSYFATSAILPEYNTEYGGGYDLSLGLSYYSNWGAKFTNPPALVDHPYDKAYLNADFPQYKGDLNYAYKFYNSVHNFFRTGYSENTAVNVAGSAKDINYNVSYSHDQENGYIPNNTLGKNNLGMGGTAKLGNKFTVSGTLNYVKTDVSTPPTSNSTGNNAQNTSVFGNVLYTPTAIDLMNLPYEDPFTHASVYYRSGNDIQNPRWTLYNAFTQDNVNRVFGQVSLKYDIGKNLNLLYRYGLDYYNEYQLYAQNKGGISFPTGIMSTSSADNKTSDNTLTLNYDKQLNRDVSLSVVAGANDKDVTYSELGLTSTSQLVYGLLNQGNFVDHTTGSPNGSPLNYKQETQTLGVFAQATAGYRGYLYVTAGGRNSWGSSVEEKNRSIFYPSISGSFVPTEAIESLKNNKYVNYLKVRVGYATSANFPPPYSTRASLNTQTKAFVTSGGASVNTNSIEGQAPNLNLKPELLKEVELGLEGKFFDTRLSLDLTFYRRVSDNQILTESLDPSTGFTSQLINAGNVVNRGIEAAAGYTIIRSRDWRWQLDGQFTLNRSMVSQIPSAVGIVTISGFSNQGTIAKNGYPLGVIYGSYIARDANGNKLVSSTGDYLTSNDDRVIGDPNPKWKTTGINTVSYKRISFRMQWDYTYGGDMYSGTIGALLGRGVTKDTEFDRAIPVILPGVLQNGQKNNIQITATDAYFNNNTTGGFGGDETGIYDATVIRLREASLSYVLPDKLFRNTPIGSVSISLSGSNLWYYTPNMPKYIHFDPETSGFGVGNGKGFDYLSGPSARRFGGSIRVTF